MYLTKANINSLGVAFGDLLILIFAMYLSVFLRSGTIQNVFEKYTGASIFTIGIYMTTFYVFDLCNTQQSFRKATFLSRYLFGIFVSATFIALMFYYFPSWKVGRGSSAYIIILFSVTAYGWRILYQSVSTKTVSPRKVAIMGCGNSGHLICDLLSKSMEHRIVGIYDDDPSNKGILLNDHKVIGPSEDLIKAAENAEFDVIVLAITHKTTDKLMKNLLLCKTLGIDIVDMPIIYEAVSGKLPVLHIKNSWIVYTPFQGLRKSIYTNRVKRIIDISLSSVGLIVFFPVLFVSAIAIKLDSTGPMFFWQKRIGLNEKEFEVVKLRSMDIDAENGTAVWAEVKDPRITKVGKFLRKFHIDEIPQMWNVLKGDMSFFGPRPERPEFVEMLNRVYPLYYMRHLIKPGITGWAQINFRYGASKEDSLEKLQYDLFYIKNLSPLLDLQIFLRTIRVVLFGSGSR